MPGYLKALSDFSKEKAKQRREESSIDAIAKMAAIKEAGYDVQPQGMGMFGGGYKMNERPDYIGLKELQRQKALRELDPNYEANQAAAKERAVINARLSEKRKFGNQGASGIPSNYEEFMDSMGNTHVIKKQNTPEQRMAKLEDEVAKSELTSQAKALPKLDQALQASNQLKKLYDKAVTPQSVKKGNVVSGIIVRAKGVPKTISALSGANPSLKQYLANRKAFSGNIAKGGFGEAGMLTTQDIDRITSILPNEYSTKEEADIAWSEIGEILGSARARFEESKKKYFGSSSDFSNDEDEYEEDNDPIVKTGVDEQTGQRVGMTASGKIVPLE